MNLIEKFKLITTFILDVDGVLTDGTVYVFDSGEQVRRMSIKDGFALQLAIKKGYRILVISGGSSPAVITRLKKLGITDIFMNVTDKKSMLKIYAGSQLKKEQVPFMGADIPDYVAMKAVGLPAAPADAALEIRENCSVCCFSKRWQGLRKGSNGEGTQAEWTLGTGNRYFKPLINNSR